MSTIFVCGLCFDRNTVVLIQKNRPTWQTGLWNGIGGKCLPHERPDLAMVREFREETGAETRSQDWSPFLDLSESDGDVVHFRFNV